MPAIEQTIANVNVRSHTFKFISPVVSERDGMPNPCTTCHKDKSNQWALDALEHLAERFTVASSAVTLPAR